MAYVLFWFILGTYVQVCISTYLNGIHRKISSDLFPGTWDAFLRLPRVFFHKFHQSMVEGRGTIWVKYFVRSKRVSHDSVILSGFWLCLLNIEDKRINSREWTPCKVHELLIWFQREVLAKMIKHLQRAPLGTTHVDFEANFDQWFRKQKWSKKNNYQLWYHYIINASSNQL